MNKHHIDPLKLRGLTTDGAPAMTGKNNGFSTKLIEALDVKEVVIYHCIIHQENLCSKVLDFPEVMKQLVKCVNFIRSRGLNHRQFKEFLEDINSDCEDVVYFSAVRWLSRVKIIHGK